MWFLKAFFYDRLMKTTEDACLINWRRELLKNISGKVLELGAGTGASLDLYPKRRDIEIFLSEPDKSMRQQLVRKVNVSGYNNITVLTFPAEKIESDDDKFDFVFATLVCCSVRNINNVLSEINRVLKPDGSFIFLEHVAAKQGTNRRKWQNRLNGLWRILAGNCHLNRETELLILEAGFNITEIKYESMKKSMALVSPTIRGVAKPIRHNQVKETISVSLLI